MQYNFFFFLILNIIVGIIAIHSDKYRRIWTFVLLGSVWMIMSCAELGSIWTDMDNYYVSYSKLQRGIELQRDDALFYFLMKLCGMAGLSFFEYKAVFHAIQLIIIYKIAQSYNANVPFVLLFYSLHAMYVDIEIMRFAIAGAIAILSMKHLMSKKRGDILKYIIAVLFAAQFHGGAYLFLVFAFVNYKILMFIKKYWYLVIGAVIVILYNPVLLGEFSKILNFITMDERYLQYASQRTRFGWFPALFIWLLSMLLSMYVNREILKGNTLCDKAILKKNLYIKNGKLSLVTSEYDYLFVSQGLYKFIVASVIFVPLSVLTLHMVRYPRILSLLVIAYMASAYEHFKRGCTTRKVIFAGMLIITICWMIYDMQFYILPEWIEDSYINGTWFWMNTR